MVEHDSAAGVVAWGHVGGCLLVQPRRGQPTPAGNLTDRLGDSGVVVQYQSVDVMGEPVTVIGHRHRGASHNVYACCRCADTEQFGQLLEYCNQFGASHHRHQTTVRSRSAIRVPCVSNAAGAWTMASARNAFHSGGKGNQKPSR